jgi:hypothetical protein
MQASAVIVVDSEAALAQGTLENNTRIVHDTRALFDVEGDPGGDVMRIVGALRPSGIQATEATVNWTIVDIDPAYRSRVVSIRGPAVDDGVLYPARYFSPDPETDGAYWSAGVGCERMGRFPYVMDVVITARAGGAEHRFELLGWIEVISATRADGFTGRYEPGELPMRTAGRPEEPS